MLVPSKYLDELNVFIKSSQPDWFYFLSQNSTLTTFINPMFFAKRNKYVLEKAYEEYTNIYVDGKLMAEYCSRKFRRNIDRVSFDSGSAAPGIFLAAKKLDMKIYLIGGTREEVNIAKNIIHTEYEVNIAGVSHGFLSAEEIKQVVNKLSIDPPDILICGMGMPLQEITLRNICKSAGIKHGFTCGAFLSQIANVGSLRYYPEWVEKSNLRALYRAYKEGPRLWKRYIIDYFPFYLRCLKREF